MAAVVLADFAVHSKHEGDVELAYLSSPSTMDSADTVDITALLDGRVIADLYAWDVTSEVLVTATVSSSVITVDSGGGTTNHRYIIKVAMLR